MDHQPERFPLSRRLLALGVFLSLSGGGWMVSQGAAQTTTPGGGSGGATTSSGSGGTGRQAGIPPNFGPSGATGAPASGGNTALKAVPLTFQPLKYQPTAQLGAHPSVVQATFKVQDRPVVQSKPR